MYHCVQCALCAMFKLQNLTTLFLSLSHYMMTASDKLSWSHYSVINLAPKNNVCLVIN